MIWQSKGEPTFDTDYRSSSLPMIQFNFAAHLDCAHPFPKPEMTLPRKNSRSLLVDAVRFRYIVSSSEACEEGLFSLSLTVQIAGGRGGILQVHGILTRDSWLDFPEIESADKYVIVKPRHVVAIIRRARSSGWDPTVGGKPLLLTISAAEFQI